MRARVVRVAVRWVVLAASVCLLTSARAEAQGDGPHNLPLLPIDTNIFTPQVLVLSGNFNPAGDTFIPRANVDVVAVPVTYIRTFPLGSRFARLFVVVPLSTLDVSASDIDPRTGRSMTVSRGRSGFMDPIVSLHIGLVGAPALKPAEFVKHPKSFQMYGVVGTSIPVGAYDSDRLINLGTNKWAIRTGIGTVIPFGAKKRTALETNNSLYFFTANNDPFRADKRTQDPLYVLENHLTHNFNPKVWGSVDLRYQYGGTTTTDNVSDDNLTNALGGGGTLGYQFTPHFGAWTSFGRVWAGAGNVKQHLFRFQIVYSF